MKRAWRRVAAVFLFVMILSSFAPVAAQEKTSVLDEILEILRRGGQITEDQQKELRERAKREEQGRFLAGIDDNLKPFLRSADGDFRLELGGFVQFDFDAADDDARLLTGPHLINEFLVRRARLSMTGQLFKWIGFKIEGDFGTQQNPAFALTDGYIDLNFMPAIGLRGGQFKVPFSLEELTSDLYLDTIERSMANELVPSRDVGVMLQGQFFNRVLGYSVGLFNGSNINAPDNNNEKAVAGRVTGSPFRNTDILFLKGLQIGANGTFGDEDSRLGARGRTLARTANRFQFFAQQPINGNRYRWGVDLAWLVGPASLKFEYDQQIDQRNKLGPGGTDLDDITGTGWYVTGTFVVTGENAVLNGPVIPRRPFSPIAGKLGPGAWELVLRYQELRFKSDDPVDFFDGNINNGIPAGARTAENGAKAVTGGINWYLNSRVRAMVNYTQYWFDNSVGTPFSCRQSVCGAANLQRSHDSSWEVLSRLQLWF